MFLQQRANDIALHAFAFAVDQTHFAEAGVFALIEKLFDDAGNFLGLKGMKIEMILDGNNDRIGKWWLGIDHLSALAASSLAFNCLATRFRCERKTAAKIAIAAMPVAKLGMNASTVAAAKSSHSIKFIFT